MTDCRTSPNPTKDRVAAEANPDVMIVTRSMHQELYEMSVRLLSFPWPKTRVRGAGAVDYLTGLLQCDAEWIVSIDEDAFVWRPQAVSRLLHHMMSEDYVCCGCPDGKRQCPRAASHI